MIGNPEHRSLALEQGPQWSVTDQIKTELTTAVVQHFAGAKQSIQTFYGHHSTDPEQHAFVGRDSKSLPCSRTVARVESVRVDASPQHMHLLRQDTVLEGFLPQVAT